MSVRIQISLLFCFVLLVSVVAPAHAYIGPGAGFAFLGSAFVFVLTFFMALATLLFWPLQWCVRRLRGGGLRKTARAKRVIVVGLDGLEPRLTERFMKEGSLPHLSSLAQSGSYSRLGTTLPPLSPVAWSTFQTGVNPGAHNIFDFLTRDKRFCLPQLCSTETEPVRRALSFGPFSIPIGRAKIRLMRKSQPFWKILGSHGIFSTILRVPISYPPEKFFGNILSAMCTPDLRGTQGSFCVYTTNEERASGRATSGEFKLVEISPEGSLQAEITGPPNPYRRKATPLTVPFSLEHRLESDDAVLKIEGEEIVLKRDVFSPWVTLTFRFGLRQSLTGICRFCLRSLEPDFSLYVSPININPEKPALPIAYPIFFSSFLAKRQGLYGTLGFLEDTWGRNEEALDDERFLQQTYLTHAERETMFFEALERTNEGVCACVFDASDRIQHMFWRYIDEEHPAPKEDAPGRDKVIPEMYERMDALVGKVVNKLRDGDVLVVLSDHGFTTFRRSVNLNTWLREQGYLSLKDGSIEDSEYFQNVDWQKTRAFAVGLSGIYINKLGRERWGVVEEDEVRALKEEIGTKLEQITDPQTSKKAVFRVYDTELEYRGLYRDDAPDLIVGFRKGYRTSWESVIGGIESEVFSNNIKAWSGDHDVAPELVPGVLFTNHKLTAESPHIMDLAPTILNLFSVPIPGYMEGKVVL